MICTDNLLKIPVTFDVQANLHFAAFFSKPFLLFVWVLLPLLFFDFCSLCSFCFLVFFTKFTRLILMLFLHTLKKSKQTQLKKKHSSLTAKDACNVSHAGALIPIIQQMTSPIRLDVDYSYIEGEKFSPIRVSADFTRSSMLHPARDHDPAASEGSYRTEPVTGSPISKTGTFSAAGASAHPHGLAAKHDARRNTIHGPDQTPVRRAESLVSSTIKPLAAPLTSPRVFGASTNTGSSISRRISSIRKSKTALDTKLGESNPDTANKENIYRLGKASRVGSPNKPQPNHTQPLSSPLTKKRHHEGSDSPLKIAKVVTNANDSFVSQNEQRLTSEGVRVDEVFVNEDLVGQFANKSQESIVVSVIDNDSDSDLTSVHNQHPGTDVSMTIVPKAHGLQDVTQSGKIVIAAADDYITPQRMTEPFAKSPTTDQRQRVIEDVEVENTTPLKRQNNRIEIEKTDIEIIPETFEAPKERETVEFEAVDDADVQTHTETVLKDSNNIVDNIESDDDDKEIVEVVDEPTINFAQSPDSTPVFSVTYIKKIQEAHSKEEQNLENIIYHKNQEILKFSEELSSTNGKFLIFDQEIKELTLAKKKLIANEEILKVQLQHTEHELAKCNKIIKSKTGVISKFEEKVNKLRAQIKQQQQHIDELKLEVESLNESIESKDKQIKQQENKNLEITASKIESEKAIYEKDKEILKLTESSLSLNKKIEDLLQEKQTFLVEIGVIKQENEELQAINDKQTNLVEELDKLEALAKNKIETLELAIDSQKLKFEDERHYQSSKFDKFKEQSENLEFSLRKDLELVEEKLKTNELERDHLKSKLENSDSRISVLNSKIKELEHESESFSTEQLNLKEQIESLKSTNKEKDLIITEDTKKMNELVETVNELRKKENEKPAATNNEKEVLSLEKQVKELQNELSVIDENHQRKIQQIAELLYVQYSKKHEHKVQEVRKTMERKLKAKLESLNQENQSQFREIESLKKNLDIVNLEKNQLLGLIEEYKAIAEGSKKRSPRSPRRQAPRY